MKGSNNRIRGAFLSLTAALIIGAALPSAAQIVTMLDGNSSASINTSSQAGMYNWSVDGQNQLYQQWFWFRLGSSGIASSIDTIGPAAILNPDPRHLTTIYTAPTFSIQVSYVIAGGAIGSGASSMNESITISNRTSSPLSLHFYQYSDFDLGASLGGQTVQLGTDIHGHYNYALQTKGSSILQEADINPSSNHGEANLYANTLNSLNTTSGYTLNDSPGPVTGDATWAFEWDYESGAIGQIGANQTALISKTLTIQVPEPSAIAMIGLGLLVCGWRARRVRS